MGANHAHGTAVPSSRRTLVATLAVLVPLAIVTLASLLWLWPDGSVTGTTQAGVERLHGTITSVTLKPCPPAADGLPKPDPATCGNAKVKAGDGPDVGEELALRLPSAPGAQRFAAGEDVILLREADGTYLISDHDRATPLWLFGAAFALAVIAFGRWRGVTALVGLAVTFVLLLTFVIPGIIEGKPPMLVAIVGAAAIMLTVLFLTHGFSKSTSMAVLGTLASLALTGALSYGALVLAKLNGVTDDASVFTGMSLPIDMRGLLLAGIIIGALGVLDDVTVTQAVTVDELAHANPSYGFRRLYRAASRIGRAHIASVINTIILAYAGASLPLLLLFSIGSQPLGDVLTTPVIAQEIVRSVAGTLGLISAVPITTALAALAASRSTRHADETPEHGDGREGFFRRQDDADDDFFSRPADEDDGFFSSPGDDGPGESLTGAGRGREAGRTQRPDRRGDSPVPEGGFFTPATGTPATGRYGPSQRGGHVAGEDPSPRAAERGPQGGPADLPPSRHRRRRAGA